MKANYTKSSFEGVEMQSGEFATGRVSGAAECNMSESSFWRKLQNLQKWGNIVLKSNSRFTIVSLCNWRTYNAPDESVTKPGGQQKVLLHNSNHISKVRKIEQQNNSTTPLLEQTYNGEELESGQRADSGRTAGGQRADTEKEGKKERREERKKHTGAGKPPSGFVIPTIEEVSQYCLERQNGINPEAFIDFYTSKGWMVGKNKMQCWQAAIRTWEQKNDSTPSANGTPKKYHINSAAWENIHWNPATGECPPEPPGWIPPPPDPKLVAYRKMRAERDASRANQN
jgi:hypothetical protein